jgi:adenine deaminase
VFNFTRVKTLSAMHTLSAYLIDIHHRRIFPAEITVHNGIIESIRETPTADNVFVLPGFIDAHVHVESSMLVPTEFARLAVVHGTVATVSDPHEIANINGMAGVRFMIANGKQSPFKFFFGAPSCVPATAFETAGATLDAENVAELLNDADIWYLSEMMNYPGVLHRDQEVMAKIAAAQRAGKPVDGHAPGLRGAEARAYAQANLADGQTAITTDHECYTLEEALDKIPAGMHILIREGSAAKNYEALHPLLGSHPDKVMFCSDDKHPDELAVGHINDVVKRSLEKGYDLYDVLCAACLNPVQHYRLPVGLLRVGDPADFIIIDHPGHFNVLATYIDGEKVAEGGKTFLRGVPIHPINHFHTSLKQPEDFGLPCDRQQATIRVIEALEGQLVTRELQMPARIENGHVVSDPEQDVLKLTVVNRYQDAPPAVAFIKNFGLKRGAIASTVAHDCHNIIAVGADDDSLCAAVNALIECKGGIAVAESATHVSVLPLPIAGLMTGNDGYLAAAAYTDIDRKAKALGTPLKAPFMTLSFMALLVIPALKLSDRGLFNGSDFTFTNTVLAE